jgi:hypothetical protein
LAAELELGLEPVPVGLVFAEDDDVVVLLVHTRHERIGRLFDLRRRSELAEQLVDVSLVHAGHRADFPHHVGELFVVPGRFVADGVVGDRSAHRFLVLVVDDQRVDFLPAELLGGLQHVVADDHLAGRVLHDDGAVLAEFAQAFDDVGDGSTARVLLGRLQEDDRDADGIR